MDLEASPAWTVLPRSARKVFAAIKTEIARGGGDSAPCTYDALQFEYHCGAPTQALRLLRYLKLISVEPGKAGRYRLDDGWREIDQAQAEKLIAAAREVRPRDSGRTTSLAG